MSHVNDEAQWNLLELTLPWKTLAHENKLSNVVWSGRQPVCFSCDSDGKSSLKITDTYHVDVS